MNLRTVFRKKKRWEPQEWGRELRKVQPRRPVPVRPLSASRPDPAPALEPRNPSCRCRGPSRSGRSQPRLPRVWRPRPAHGGLPQVRPPLPSGCRKRPLRALPRLFRGLSRPKCEISVADSHRARVRGAMAPPGGPGLQRGSRDRPSPLHPSVISPPDWPARLRSWHYLCRSAARGPERPSLHRAAAVRCPLARSSLWRLSAFALL